MNFYIDFEATQPGNEIISIGAVSDDGATFSCLVKPVASEITPFITELTGITVEKSNMEFLLIRLLMICGHGCFATKAPLLLGMYIPMVIVMQIF